MSVLLSIIGAQPIPNLIPILQMQPDRTILVRTDQTRAASENLQQLIPKTIQVEVLTLSNAFDVASIMSEISSVIDQLDVPWSSVTVNMTGGTKLMSLAAFLLAQRHRCPLLYLETRPQECLHQYRFTETGELIEDGEPLPIQDVLTLDTYIRVYMGTYCFNETDNAFEKSIEEILMKAVADGQLSEVMPSVRLGTQIEVDFIVRLRNRIGIVEAKTGNSARKRTGFDQLNTAAFGTYTRKFYIPDNWNEKSSILELAASHDITVIPLHSHYHTKRISTADAELLVATLHKNLSE